MRQSAISCRTIFSIALAVSLGANAVGADDATARANTMAYRAAMKCFVANGHAVGLRQRAGDTAKAAVYESKARLSFDTAVKLGRALGYSGDRINEDFGLAQTRELPPMVTDQRYFISAVATCKALGLM